MTIMQKIGQMGLVPVAVIEKADDAVPTAKALLDGGLNVMEITLRTDAALNAIKNVHEEFPEMLIGAGTVLSVQRAKGAVDAGAEFIVSPGLNPKVVKWCISNDTAICPGSVTPSEIETAMSFNLDIVKFFPASIYGGIKAIKALHGPYRNIKFIPTGGVNNDNLSDYADKDYIHAIGGGWICSESDINSHNFTNITSTVKKAIDILLGFEINNIKDGKPIKTNSIDRALYYLSKRGYKVVSDTKKEKNGKATAIHLKNQIEGFIIELI